MAVRVQSEPFDAGNELAIFLTGRQDSGGVASFTGIVRDHNAEGRISAMTLEHYPGMTEGMLERIEGEARRRWQLDDSLIIHRFGRLQPGESIVLVITASAHRRAAFEACEFLIDWLKTKAPFWKQEEMASGETLWVEAQASDDEAAARWTPRPGKRATD
jgi:molybdopterin synthase catalytic subunit